MNKKIKTADSDLNTAAAAVAAAKAERSNRRFLAALICSVLFLGSVAAFAGTDVRNLLTNSRPQVKIVLSGTVERNKETISVEKAGEVKSGEVMRWKLVSENAGNAGAADYKAVGQIPAGTVFVADSARADGNSIVTYSIDGGKTFSAQPTVEEKQPDGSAKKVAAPVESYTQVRFEAQTPLNAGEKLNAFYSVRVK